MAIPAKLIEFLNQHKVRYTVLHHPEAFTAQELSAIEGIKGRYHAKVVMVKTGDQMIMAVLPADHRIELERIERLSGARALLATEAEFKDTFPDCAVGTMPPFGKLYDVPTWVDKSLTEDDYIVFEAGTHTDAIRMSYADYARLAEPTVADFAVKLH
ncbi:MAG: deacylase [Verrucomicrobia bacterium]|nr:deacylase [Verrucomicrobiota bacterium]